MFKKFRLWLDHWANVLQLYLLQLEIHDARKSKNWIRYYSLRMDEVVLLRKIYP